VDQRSGNHTANTRENVPNEVVERNSRGSLARHELGEHGSGHAEDQHATNTEEEICNDLVLPLAKAFHSEQAKLTGPTQKTPFCTLHPYHIIATGKQQAAIHAFSLIRSSGLKMRLPFSSIRPLFRASLFMM
jgi:hypothetical protein